MVCDCGTPWTFLLPFFILSRLVLRVGIKLYRSRTLLFSFTSYIFAQNNQAFHISQKCLIWHISACIFFFFFSEFQQGKGESRATSFYLRHNGTYVCDRCKIIEQNINELK